jgi:membrane-bound serine protease (ClpP class)
MARRRFLLLVVAVCALAGLSVVVSPRMAVLASPTAADSNSTQEVVELRIDDEIEPVLAEYIVNGINQANQRHAGLILITLSTPGGLDTSMRQIIQAILSSKVPVVTYVYPTGSRAASAGFFILLSADVDAMAPGTDTGAASPITAIGGQPVQVDQTLAKKILNEANAYLRSYAAKRGRNPELASTAVTDAKAFTDKEALDGHLVDLLANSPQDLFAKLNGRTITRFDGTITQLNLAHPVVVPFEMNGREKFLQRIVQPDVFFVLLILGALGLYVEFTHPGLFAPGVIGGIAVLLALFSMHLLPVNLAGILLLVLALALFALEAKYPTHGVLGVGGVICMILGALMLIRSPLTGMGVSLFTALSVAIPFAVIVVILTRLVLRSHVWKPSTGREEMIGEEGQVTEPVGAGTPGMVFVHGELWRATAVNGLQIPKGARVRVKKVAGLTLEVEPVAASPQAVA